MNIVQFIRELHSTLTRRKCRTLSREELTHRDLFVSRSVCKSLARGNISLINGKYLTTQQLEERRNKNLSYQFTK